jgi:hypothetical protein
MIRKRRIPKLLLKLDIAKAFDTVAWSFLLDVIHAMGFDTCWRRWMDNLFSIASSSILLNGQPRPMIKHRHGVRQGDSLSTMLFIIAMEVLGRLFTKAHQHGVLRSLSGDGIKF